MKEREGHDLAPEQDLDRHRMMMGAMGQMPGLRQFVESIVFNVPPQVAPIPDGRAGITIQVPGHDPNPVLLFLLGDPLSADALALKAGFPHTDHSHRLGVGIAEGHLTEIPKSPLCARRARRFRWALGLW